MNSLKKLVSWLMDFTSRLSRWISQNNHLLHTHTHTHAHARTHTCVRLQARKSAHSSHWPLKRSVDNHVVRKYQPRQLERISLSNTANPVKNEQVEARSSHDKGMPAEGTTL